MFHVKEKKDHLLEGEGIKTLPNTATGEASMPIGGGNCGPFYMLKEALLQLVWQWC